MAKVANTPDSRVSPRVAVIVPAYGVAHLVGEALASLQAQTMATWECVVIDDGAPDEVAEAVAPFLADPRIRFIATGNHGVSAARNAAIAATSAPLIALLDGDDRFRPDYLTTMVALLEGDPTVRLATCNALLFGALPREQLCFTQPQGSSDGVGGTLADVLDRSFSVYIGTTFRRADFDHVGGFNESMTHSEDLDLWVRLLELGGSAHYVDQVLGEYRVRPHSASDNPVRLLQGNLKVYLGAQQRLAADHPAQGVIAAMLEETRAALDFEHALLRIAGGEVERGLSDLRAVRSQVKGPVWTFSFALWRLMPGLARPMLGWRRAARARSTTRPSLAAVLTGSQA
ncbi:MAG: glycosyltransferase family A protein [Pseudomonadota bacterium]|nr:glycosyltransferase family A protein [Pseudomonadota bacterium]